MKPSALTSDILQDYVAGRLDGATHERVARALRHDRATARQMGALSDTRLLMRECVSAPSDKIPADWIAILDRRRSH